VSQTLQALDFSAPRSKRDADLLYEAKYGKRGEDGRMSREQYGALRRKIGGTAKVRCPVEYALHILQIAPASHESLYRT
jgi:hypothetical protein